MKTINILFDYTGHLDYKNKPRGYMLVPCYKHSLETRKDASLFNALMEAVKRAVHNTIALIEPEAIKILTHVAVLEKEKNRPEYPESSVLNNLYMFWSDRRINSSRDENMDFVHENHTFLVVLEEYPTVTIEEHAFHVSRTEGTSKRFKSIYKYGK